MSIKITVHGTPQPAGSKRGFYISSIKRVVITDANAKSKPWKSQVSSAAIEVVGENFKPLDGPIALSLTFYRERPKGHFKPNGCLNKKGLESPYPTSKPDTTKLLRGVEDALTKIIWRDDSQVVQQYACKVWGDAPRVEIEVTELEMVK